MKFFIPIKQNSQRVPGKNFRSLGAEPLYKHVLLKYIDFEIFVDTDSDEIISEVQSDSRLSHVTAYCRREDQLGDKVSVCDLIENFIVRFKINEPIVQTHITSPFLTPEMFEEAYSYMDKYDSVVSCNTHNSRFWRKEEYGYCPLNHNPLRLEQTQDLPVLYEENSAFYIFLPPVVLESGNRIGKNPYFFPLVSPHNMDIDTEDDWKQAQKMLENKC
tara:strand:+ start:9381 stop:10031 length:651 start_codon:yes stop_codon:yes gene_type:complete